MNIVSPSIAAVQNATKRTTLTSLPAEGCGSHIASFLPEKDAKAFPVTCRALARVEKCAQLLYHYPIIQSFASDTFVGRLAQEQRSIDIDSEDGRVELVKRVRQIAAAYIGSNLNAEDWGTLGIPSDTPISNLSYRKLNETGTIIKDRLLLKNVDDIFGQGQILLNPEDSLSDNARILRNWLANMPNHINSGRALRNAAGFNNLEIVHAILQNRRRAISAFDLGWILTKAVETGNLEVVQAILQSGRIIDSAYLNWALNRARRARHQEIASAIRQRILAQANAAPAHSSKKRRRSES